MTGDVQHAPPLTSVAYPSLCLLRQKTHLLKAQQGVCHTPGQARSNEVTDPSQQPCEVGVGAQFTDADVEGAAGPISLRVHEGG